MYEDGRTQERGEEFYTQLKAAETDDGEYLLQSLEINSQGDALVIPQNRQVRVLFKDISPENEVRFFKNGEKIVLEKCLTDCAAIEFLFEAFATYRIEVRHRKRSWLEKQIDRSLEVMLRSEGSTPKRYYFWEKLKSVKTIDEYCQSIEEGDIAKNIKERLKETV